MNALLGDDAPAVESALPCLTILFHPDVRRIGEIAVLHGVAEEAESVLARRELGFASPHGGEEIPLHDPYLSRRPIRFSAARFGGIRLDSRNSGTRVVANGDWIPADRVFLGVEVKRGVVLVLSERVVLLLHNTQEHPVAEGPSYGLVGCNQQIVRLRRSIDAASENSETLLIRGESGVGKSTVASAIHHHSARGDAPFVQIDLSEKPVDITEALAEADGGTLHLKAIEKLSDDGREELLRLLESGEHKARILTSTAAKAARRWHKDADQPLLKRLAENALLVPPLPDRRDDIGRLLIYFLIRETDKTGCPECLKDPGPYQRPWLSVRVVSHLVSYEWPRNVTQLKNVIRQLVAENGERDELTHGPALEQLLETTAESPDDWEWGTKPEPQKVALRKGSEVSEGELLTALRAHRWQARPTAAQLQISEEDLFSMIEKLSETTRRRRRRRRPPPPS